MRISDWSSDVCSSDLFMLEQIEHDRNSLIVGYLIGIIGNKAFEVRRYPPLTDPFGDRGPFGPQFTARVVTEESCSHRIGKRDRDVGITGFESHADTGKRAAGANRAYETITFPSVCRHISDRKSTRLNSSH